MTLRVNDWESKSDLDSICNSCDVSNKRDYPFLKALQGVGAIFFEGTLIVLRCKIGKVLKCQSTYVSPSSYTFWGHKRNSFSFKENHNSISCSNIFLVQVFRFGWALAKVKAGLCFSRAGENFSWFCVNLLIKSGVWSGVEGMGWYGEGRRGDEGEEEEILFGEKSEQKSDEDLRNLFPA